MRRFLTILGIAGVVVLLLLVAVSVAVSTVDPNNFIGPIQARVKAATGRDLAIGGGIALQLGLEPKLVVNDVRVGNAPWASTFGSRWQSTKSILDRGAGWRMKRTGRSVIARWRRLWPSTSKRWVLRTSSFCR